MARLEKEILNKIRHIGITTTHLAEDLLLGNYHSAFKGKGIEFEEVRQYNPGDDIRSIDWKVTARMNAPYVKNFKEERQLTVMLVVDVSASSNFGSHEVMKSELIAEIAGIIAFSAIKNDDRVGLILFSDTIEKYIPPKKGMRHVMRIIRELLAFPVKQVGTNMSNALRFLGKVQRKAGISFLISDFLCRDYEHEMALIAKRHDLIAMEMRDPYDIQLPKLNQLTLRDAESGETVVINTSNRAVQEQHHREANERHEALSKATQKIGASLIELWTHEPYLPVINRFFKMRAARRR